MVMIVSPDALRKDVVQIIQQINAQIDEVERVAKEMGISSAQLRDHQNNWVMTPLLLAKTQAYATLVALNEQGRKR